MQSFRLVWLSLPRWRGLGGQILDSTKYAHANRILHLVANVFIVISPQELASLATYQQLITVAVVGADHVPGITSRFAEYLSEWYPEWRLVGYGGKAKKQTRSRKRKAGPNGASRGETQHPTQETKRRSRRVALLGFC